MPNSSSNKPQRLDPIFAKTIQDILGERVQKGLSKPKATELSFREGTRLILKTDGWKKVVEELRTKPKKYDTV